MHLPMEMGQRPWKSSSFSCAVHNRLILLSFWHILDLQFLLCGFSDEVQCSIACGFFLFSSEVLQFVGCSSVQDDCNLDRRCVEKWIAVNYDKIV